VNTTSKLEVTSQLCYCKHEPHPVSKLLHGISTWFGTELVGVAFCKDLIAVLMDINMMKHVILGIVHLNPCSK
jgi:hypothetical protein